MSKYERRHVRFHLSPVPDDPTSKFLNSGEIKRQDLLTKASRELATLIRQGFKVRGHTFVDDTIKILFVSLLRKRKK